jgi:hypothetical protein
MASAAFGVPARPQPRDPVPDTLPDEAGTGREEPSPEPREPGPAPSQEPDDPRPSQDPDPDEPDRS